VSVHRAGLASAPSPAALAIRPIADRAEVAAFEVGMSAAKDAPDHHIQLVDPILLHRLSKLANMPTNPSQIHPRTMKDEQAFDMLILRPPRDRLVDHEVLRLRNLQCRAAHLDRPRCYHRL
jgi:hypothetical protein